MSTNLVTEELQNGTALSIRGIDLAETELDSDLIATLERHLGTYGILVFPDQILTEERQDELSRAFGELCEIQSSPLLDGDGRFSDREYVRRLPLFQDPREFPEAMKGVVEAKGKGSPIYFLDVNENASEIEKHPKKALGTWHADQRYYQNPFVYSFLNCLEAPDFGFETQYANLFKAYEALPQSDKEELEHLTGVFWGGGMYPDSASEKGLRGGAFAPPVLAPLVKTNPVTGKRSMHCPSRLFLKRLEGRSIKDSRDFIKKLTEHATQDEFVYSHEWKKGDVVIWDNRSTMHRRGKMVPGQTRILRRTMAKREWVKQDICHAAGEVPDWIEAELPTDLTNPGVNEQQEPVKETKQAKSASKPRRSRLASILRRVMAR